MHPAGQQSRLEAMCVISPDRAAKSGWRGMSKAKAVSQVIKLVIKAGQAKPGPPVGAALGQAGLKIIDFTKDFNAKTAEINVGCCCSLFPGGQAVR